MSTKKDALFLSDDEKKSCCNPVSLPEGSTPHNCVEEWNSELKTVTTAYNEALAKANGAEGIYNNSFTWETKLKKWIDNAHEMHVKGIEIYTDLDLFVKVTGSTEHHTNQTSLTLEALLCLVKKIFELINELLPNSVNSADPIGLIQKLKDYIECLNQLDDQKKKEAMDCIAVYEAKVQAIYELQADMITKLLEALHASNMLATAMGNAKKEQNLGLRWQLKDLRSRIIGMHTSDMKQEQITHSPCVTPGPKPVPPCGVAVLNPASKLLPIEDYDHNGTPIQGSDYFKQLSKLYEDAKKDSGTAKATLTSAREARDKIAAKKNSLTEAIKAATAAIPTK